MKKVREQKKRQHCSLLCKSHVSELKSVEKVVRQFVKANKLDNETQYKLLVATTEAVNNAIFHGNEANVRKSVKVTCCAYKRKIVVRVRDFGKGFDVTKLPDPTTPANLLKEHGRGVFLIRALMDDVKFRKLKSGLVVTMSLVRD